MGELKVCPFCGCDKPKLSNRLVVQEQNIKTLYKVHCPNCMASVNEYDTEYGAIAAWNMRFIPAQEDES